MAATRLALLIIEEIPKGHLIIDPEIRNLSSGPMFHVGYHGILKTEGLMSLGLEFSSARLFSGLSKRWGSSNRPRRHSLFLACCWEWKGALCAVLIPRLILTGLTFSQPFTIQRVVEAIEDESTGHDESGGLVGAVALTFAGSALCRAVSQHMTIRLLTRVRGGLLSVLLDKNMKLRLSDARRNAIVTLMSADFDGIADGLPSCVEIPYTFLETGLGMFLLTRFVRQSSFVIIFPLIFATFIGVFYEKSERQSPGIVHFDGVSLTSFGSDEPILKGISFTLLPGSITALFGPTGSGKTSFINSILGEVEISDGTLFVDDTAIALVGQSTWLPNLALKECIVGACEYNEIWFKRVVTACHLSQDIAQLPGGVDYMVGSGGIALSGGQRQRVSMARAAYCRAKLVLLDDSFSALDRTTATAILSNLCGENGILRQSNAAVVVASYLPECLEIADNIIYLDGNGNFSYQSSQASKAFRSQILSLLRQEAACEEKADAGNKETAVQPAQTFTGSGVQRDEDTKRKQGDKALYRFWLREIGRATFATWLCIITIHGQKFGITGRSIKIDGVDIRTAPRDELRSRIVTISQDQVELDGTVRDNLLPFDTRWDDKAVTPDEEDKAEAALKDRIARETLVRLRIWDKVESKGGLTSMLEDVGYSHGEMQLLCIARAVVRRRLTGSNLLLVDEATGGVDRWRDQIVREMMKEYFRGCTIIVIAHREESIADSNVTVEMANGEMKTPRVFY
ncbi:hypothetical protein ACQRIU_006004 [Beauveria bassiana]